MLAFYHYPFVLNQAIEEYTKEDLMNPDKVEELFDYCQILEAYITESGWEFLIEHYGYKKLYEINNKSGWLDAENLDDYISWIEYEIECSKSLSSFDV